MGQILVPFPPPTNSGFVLHKYIKMHGPSPLLSETHYKSQTQSHKSVLHFPHSRSARTTGSSTRLEQRNAQQAEETRNRGTHQDQGNKARKRTPPHHREASAHGWRRDHGRRRRRPPHPHGKRKKAGLGAVRCERALVRCERAVWYAASTISFG